MNLLLLLFLSPFLLSVGWVALSAWCLYRNYQEAKKIGVPIRIIPIDHLNKLWLLVDKQVVSLCRRLPGFLGNNSFTRFNYRGWHEHDGTLAHDEMGEAFLLVSPSRNWLYLADPDALMNMYRRGTDFPRWVEITKMLDVFGGPNIATSSDETWKTHRRLVHSSLNEQTNAITWTEASAQGDAMARYWASKRVFTTVGEDTRTLSLHVLCKACFGHSFQFEGHDDRDHNSPSATFRNTLLHIMENALLILALGPKFFIQPWLPLPGAWKKLGDACDHFRDHLTKLYAQKLHSLRNRPEEKDSTLMASLIRASQTGEKGQILTESEIYGNLFVISFAGHDTTSHLITFAIFFLVANPGVQDWLAEELRCVLGTRPHTEWDYHTDFPKLKRCMAVLYETLRLKTLIAEVKWTDNQAQQLQVGDRTLNIPPRTLVIPSYVYVHRSPRFWGSDAQTWKPERWIGVRPSPNEADDIVKDQQEYLLPPPHRGNFVGWSEGSRDCPGKRFSQVEWVAIVASLFRDWKVDLIPSKGESVTEAQDRVLDFIEKNTEYGGLLLQLMDPERIPLVWNARE